MTASFLAKSNLSVAALAAMAFATASIASALQAAPECETLFVQDAGSVEMDDKTRTSDGVGPLITFFCDWPVRHAGHITNGEYLQSWDHVKASFKDDPPNAMISVLDGDSAHDVVVELLEKPTVDGDQFTYKIVIIEGEAISGDRTGTLFIDIIGRP